MLLFNHSVVSNSLWPYGLHLPRLLVFHHILEIAQTRVHWVDEVMPPSHLCHCLFLLPSIFPASGYFLKSQLFASGSPSIIASASASVLPMNIQDWFPLRLIALISLQPKGLSRVFSNTTVQKHQFLVLSLLYGPVLTSIHDHWKNHSLDYAELCWQSNVCAF